VRIAFWNPPFLPKYSRSQRSPGVIKSGTLYYPYWLAHAAALAIERGHETVLLDSPAAGLDLDASMQRLASQPPDLLVVDTSTPSFVNDLKCAEGAKAKFPQTYVAMCGTHASARPEDALANHGTDAVLLGEYDFTAVELGEALEGSVDPTTIPGLFLRDHGATNPRPPIEELDSLPWVAPVYKQFLDVRDYYFSLASHPMVMLISGRGCPNGCFFCLYPQVMHGRRYRARSPEHLAGEVEWIAKNMPQVRELVFEDDTFTADEQRTAQFCELLPEKNIRLPWFANVRVNTKPETLAIMKRAGFRSCAVGFESGSQVLLDEMHKGITVDRAKLFMENARRLGILVHGCFMVAFPGETEKTMQATLDYAISLEPDSAQFYPVFPYPGTEAYDWAEKSGYLNTTDYRRWLTDDGGHACVLDLPELPAAKIWEFCEQAYRRFHFRPKYLARKLLQAIRHPAEGWRSFRSFLYYLRYLLKGSDR
jgi:radical SAM superfamily enzyme YgiQ (UPF0313 family)